MNIGEYSVRTPVISWLIVVILVGGGIAAFPGMGKLEDPAYTIKLAKVITNYPGATAREVQEEVTYHIEDAIQRMEQLKRIKMSISRPGLSDIEIQFKDHYSTEDFPAIYDELRRRIADIRHKLPPGAEPPTIVDEFADVYGVFVAITGEGYTYRDLKDYAEDLKRQLVLVPGVRKVAIDGEQPEVVYVEISRARLGQLGISLDRIGEVLESQNAVEDAGRVRVGQEYVRIFPTGQFESVQEIGDLLISSEEGQQIYLKDVATIRRSYNEIPTKLVYFNGKPALTLGISMLSGVNVVDVGAALKARFAELESITPLGVELHQIYYQPDEVDKSVSSFIESVGQALVIVIVVLLLFMGLKVGMIIGGVLLITVAGTLWVMDIFGIELQRVSLGALVIALGMLVDNAIVIAEGMLVRIQKGMPASEAAKEVVSSTFSALIGGTAIGILAFSAIGFSQSDTGEFARSLFYVILISLSLSWVTAVSTTPLLCALLLKPDKEGADADPYGAAPFRIYRGALAGAIRMRWLTIGVVVALFALSVYGFTQVKQAFFPNANTPIFFVDLWAPEGIDIRQTRDYALQVEAFLSAQEGVEQTTTVIGGGATRFTLVYEPKEDAAAYAQIIVRTENREQIPAVWDAVENYMASELPHLDPIIKSLRIGPGRDGKIEARFHGPDPVVLRQLAEEAKAIMRADPETKEVRDDWRQPAKVLRPVFNEQVGRDLGINRQDLAAALRSSFEGAPVGLYRDGIRLLPIHVRPPLEERTDVTFIDDVQVWSPVRQRSLPIGQVVSGFETEFENTVIRGRNRLQTIIASANPTGELTNPLFERLRPQIEAIELPRGYELTWGGEYEDSFEAQDALFNALPAGFLFMIITTILLFGKLKQPLIIWLTVPLALVGLTAGLLMFGAFDFMSLLGALSLIGLLIKNAIVLIEEIDQQVASGGKSAIDAVLDSSVSRMRPVALAATTTVLGMIPLLPDVFFVNMSITIMFGLTFATLLTLFIVPTLYATIFGIKSE